MTSVLVKQDKEIKRLNKRVVELEGELVAWKAYAREASTGTSEDLMLRANNPWKLTGKELAILFAIMRRPYGVSRDQVMNAIYGVSDPNEQPEVKILDVFICKLRRKLREAGPEDCRIPRGAISTIWGRGYKLENDARKRLIEILGMDPSHDIDELPKTG